jgi:hypothetical protein
MPQHLNSRFEPHDERRNVFKWIRTSRVEQTDTETRMYDLTLHTEEPDLQDIEGTAHFVQTFGADAGTVLVGDGYIVSVEENDAYSGKYAYTYEYTLTMRFAPHEQEDVCVCRGLQDKGYVTK